jgi:hypothetical protein
VDRHKLYPFNECLLTDEILTFIGFSEYWAGCGDFGDRRLDLGGKVGDERLTSKGEYPSYYIYEFDAQSGNDWGYGFEPRVPTHYADKDMVSMYFLHEMYEDILERRTPEEMENFLQRLKRKGTDLYPYIESYLKHKNKTDKQ